MTPVAAESPVSYRINVSRLPRTGLPVWLEADERQLAALAETHGLLSAERFRFDLTLTPWKGDGIRVAGKVSADITQSCVVTLEPLPAKIEADIDTVLVPEGSKLAPQRRTEQSEMVLDAEGPDLPETFSGDHIDVGALAEEFFALEIDPYPRKEGAALDTEPAKGMEAGRGPLYEKLKGLAGKT